ncbi:MAG: hypothetical protein PXY39_05705, partial [archaeon]|nr:hypothetical protein [archaeon]
MTLAIDETLKKLFPGLQVIELQMNDLRIVDKNESLEVFKREVQQKVRKSFNSMEQIRDQPIFRSYRDFFWRVGIDPT